ncbi:MAG: DNA gyrase inhibitor YacG [Gammaproteobacteria bacterium]|nr:DNA gyrase inhibitor YacG [Gammaproteobacteria bacterium]
MKTIVKCPTCNTDVEWIKESTFRPFCSERCRLIDLGEWASEKHTIAGEPIPSADDMFNPENNDDIF